MLQVQGLGKRYDRIVAVQDFSLTMQEGEFVTLLGPSGSGKTTVLRMIAGLEQPTAGVVRIGDRDVTGLPPQKRNIGVVFQSYALFPNLTVADNIAFPLKVRRAARRETMARVAELLALVGLERRAGHFPDQLSGGERQRVALARALAFRPPLLLLDEPLSALDAKVRQSLRESLKDIQRASGVTTLMVTHDQEEALEISDRIVVMAAGSIEQTGSPEEVYHAPTTAFAAGFIGEFNTLWTRVLATEPGENGWLRALLEWRGHRFWWLVREGQIEGKGVCEIRVRPESVQVFPEARDNAVGCRIEGVKFMGPLTRFGVQVGEERVTADTLSGFGPAVKPGSFASIRLVDPRLQGFPERRFDLEGRDAERGLEFGEEMAATEGTNG